VSTVLVVLYLLFLAGAFTGCATFWRSVWLRHHEAAEPVPDVPLEDRW